MRVPPFVIFALPRSRTAWLAHWLGLATGGPVAHDLAISSDSVDAWLRSLALGLRGTVETGSVEAWPLLRAAIPACRIVVVRRPVSEVARSLAEIGIAPPFDVLSRRALALETLASQPDVLAVSAADLGDLAVAGQLHGHCTGAPLDIPLWARISGLNIQLDIPRRMRFLAERRDAIEGLKADLAERLAGPPRPFVTIAEEPWPSCADEAEALGVGHHAEATAGIEGAYRLDRPLLDRLAAAGLWRVVVARIDGTMAGYCSWSHDSNAESLAPPAVLQGPFYVAPPAARHHLGRRLLEASRDILLAHGYGVARLHHTVHGRGSRAGALYELLGAVEHQREYHWRLGDGECPA